MDDDPMDLDPPAPAPAQDIIVSFQVLIDARGIVPICVQIEVRYVERVMSAGAIQPVY